MKKLDRLSDNLDIAIEADMLSIIGEEYLDVAIIRHVHADKIIMKLPHFNYIAIE